MNTIFILFFVFSIQSLALALILIFYKSKKQKVNRYLGFFFIAISVELLSYVLMRNINEYVATYNPFRFNFLNIVFIFFYATDTAGIEIKKKYRYYILAILEFLILSLVFGLVNKDPDLVYSLKTIVFLYSYVIASSIFIMFMCIRTILVIRKHNTFLPFFYTNTKYKSLLWLKIFCIMFITYLLIALASIIVLAEVEYMSMVTDSFSLLLFYYLTIGSLIQINIINITSESEVKSSKRKHEEAREMYKQVSKEIEKYMIEERGFLDPDMTLRTFTKRVGVSSRVISKTINEMGFKNFNTYLNHYRVEEFKMLLQSEKHKKYSNSALAKEVGFNSRASFYKNFKDIVGISPSDYYDSINS